MSPPDRLSAFIALLVAGAFAAAGWLGCGSAEPAREALGFDDGAPLAMPPVEVEDASGSFVEGPVSASPTGADGACALQRIPLRETQRPLDIILVLDNSVSMAGELAAVERSINRNFASVLDASGADYRVILLSRHRTAARNQTEAAKTAICVTQPLSSLAACPAAQPGNNQRFLHYPIDIDSSDSLSRVLETFDEPDALYRMTMNGWSEWLRPGSRKIFLEFSDDDSFTSAEDFLTELTAIAPDDFGASPSRPSFAFHSIVGIAPREPAGTAYAPEEPLVVDRCLADESLAPSSGRTYQTLSKLTGGLRYPLCALDDYGVIFEGIARDGIRRSGFACSFPVPGAPPGKRIDTDRIELLEARDGGEVAHFTRVPSLAECQPRAYYVAADQIELCPDLCEALAVLPSSTVSVQFDCSVFVDVR
jgi:hypothetical protein